MSSALAIGFVIVIMFSNACGSIKVSGNTKHEVDGVATIKLDVDFSVCDTLPEADRPECVKALIDILTKANDKKDKE